MTIMYSYLAQQIQKDLLKKMVFLSGPRQCGKTTLAQKILGFPNHSDRYFNWDNDLHRELLLKQKLPITPGMIVLDEIHKYIRWRNYLKGIFDLRKHELKILVTGSAKLDYYRRGGDSLQGRYHHIRMHPLTLMDIDTKNQEALESLFNFNGFPEPFFSQSESETRRWSREYRSRLVREELTSLEKVSELSLVELLMIRLPDCVSSPLSVNALREDLKVSHQTVSRWLDILENLYAIFRIYPFGAPQIRAVKKEPKHYHFDWALVENKGARFENLVACHLLKWCHWIEDTQGYDMELRYFKDNEKREVDFVVLKNRKPIYFIEVKFSYQEADLSLRYIKKKFSEVPAYQIYFNDKSAGMKTKSYKDKDNIIICPAVEFFEKNFHFDV